MSQSLLSVDVQEARCLLQGKHAAVPQFGGRRRRLAAAGGRRQHPSATVKQGDHNIVYLATVAYY